MRLSLKLDAANLRIELADAKSKIDELEQAAKRRADADPKLVDSTYVFDDPNRHYCTGCYDIGGKKILLALHTGAFKAFGKWKCPGCDKSFG